MYKIADGYTLRLPGLPILGAARRRDNAARYATVEEFDTACIDDETYRIACRRKPFDLQTEAN